MNKINDRVITVHCPGTVANLVCGFDILGLALHEPYDIMEVKLIGEPTVIIHNRDEYNLPTEPEKNVAGVVFLSAMEKAGIDCGFEVTIESASNPEAALGPVPRVLPVPLWQRIICWVIFFRPTKLCNWQ